MPVSAEKLVLKWTVGDNTLWRVRGLSVSCLGLFGSFFVKYETRQWWIHHPKGRDWAVVQDARLLNLFEKERHKFLATVLPVPHPDVAVELQAAAASYGPRFGFPPLPHWASAN